MIQGEGETGSHAPVGVKLRKAFQLNPAEKTNGAGRCQLSNSPLIPTRYAQRPFAFILRYVRRHPLGHALVLGSVLAAVGCAIGSQYAVKHLVDVLSGGPTGPIWTAFAILAGLIAVDNMFWRIAGWTATHTFVNVTGDLRNDLFRHLTGHSPAYFADRQPGTLAARITATANAIFMVESALAWHMLPPCIAVSARSPCSLS